MNPPLTKSQRIEFIKKCMAEAPDVLPEYEIMWLISELESARTAILRCYEYAHQPLLVMTEVERAIGE